MHHPSIQDLREIDRPRMVSATAAYDRRVMVKIDGNWRQYTSLKENYADVYELECEIAHQLGLA